MLPPPHFLPPGPAPLRCACVWANTWLPRSQSSNGGGRRRSCRLPVSGRGPLRLLPAQPGLFRFGVCRRSPASVGDSEQPAAPRIRAFRAPQRYLHLLGLGASAAAGQGKASRTVGGGRPPGLGLGVPRPFGTWLGIARGPWWPGARRHGVRRRRGVGPRRQPRARPVHRAARDGSARSDGRWTRPLPAGSIGSLPRAPLSPGRHVRPGPSPPRGLPSAGLCSSAYAFHEPWLLTEDSRGATLLFSDPYLTHRLCSGQLESTSLVSGHPHPPPLGAG